MAIEVQTTHNVIIDYEEASIFKRIIAWGIDISLLILWLMFCLYVVGSNISYRDLITNDNPILLLLSYLCLLSITCYHLIFENIFLGQSLGKMLMGIRVIKIDGSTPSTTDYLLRWLFRPLDILSNYGLLAIIMISCTKKSQRLGDYLAKTTVIDIRVKPANKILLFGNLDHNDQYQVLYPNVIHDFSDKDIEIIKNILRNNTNSESYKVLDRLVKRIQMKEGYNFDETQISHRGFLNKFINDYHYLATR